MDDGVTFLLGPSPCWVPFKRSVNISSPKGRMNIYPNNLKAYWRVPLLTV